MKIINNPINNSAFSLVEMLTVAVLVAIVSAIAIPSYLDHVANTKANALWAAAEAAKLYVETRYLKENATLASIDVNSGTKDFTTPTADYIKCITIQDGVVFVVGTPSAFSGNVVWISWLPTVASSRLTWGCRYSSAAATYMIDSAPSCSVGTATYSADTACN